MKTNNKIEKTKMVLQFISTISILLAAIGIWIAYNSFKAQHEWNRRQYTMELLRNYDRDAKHHADALIKEFRGLTDSTQTTKLTRREAESLYYVNENDWVSKDDPSKKKTHEELFELRAHVISYFNYMEFVCKAYEAQVVDQQIVYEAFNGIFIRRYTYFEEIVKLAQEQQSSKDSWAPIIRVVGEWRNRGNQSKILPPTG